MRGNKVGLSSFVVESPFRDSSLELLDRFRAFGYDLIEICIDDPADLTAAVVYSRLQDIGMTASVGGVFTPARDMSSTDELVRKDARAYLLECVEFAAAVGAPVVSGPMYAAVGKTALLGPSERAEQRARATEGLRAVADVAASSGVSLAIEPLNRFETDLVNTVEQAIELCDLIGAPNVGITLDTFHMNIEETSLPRAIRAAGHRLLSFQASENDRGTPGSGHIDWGGVFDALDTVEYRGPVIVESFDYMSPEIAEAVSLWRPVATSMEDLARQGAVFVHQLLERGRD